jgi:plasmid stabilization system protein ParE
MISFVPSYSLHPKARAEYRQAVEFYKGESLQAARAFAVAVRSTIDLILTFPLGSQADAHGRRVKPVRGFRYVLVYTVEDNHIRIGAILHQRRNPDLWKSRF